MEFIERKKEIKDAKMLSPLVWAYVGDSVYELFIRTNLVNNSNAKPHKLHIESIKYVWRWIQIPLAKFWRSVRPFASLNQRKQKV